MHTVDGTQYATDVELVEALAATLDLPRGQVEMAQLDHWSDGLAAHGWHVDERTDDRFMLRHPASGFLADLHVLRFTADDPQHPLLAANEEGPLRYMFSTVRLSDPAGSGLLADANLAQAPPNGAVTWLIARSASAAENADETASHTATASPFRRTVLTRLSAGVPRRALLVGLGLGALLGLWIFAWRAKAADGLE